MINLKAEERKITGRKVARLRKEGTLPANVYGKKIKSQAISVNSKEFLKVFEEAGETGLIELALGKEKRPVLVHNLQMHPVDDSPLHVDFLQVDLKEKVSAEVPVELIGESPAEKQGLGTVVLYLQEVEVEALPTDLPEKFEVDTKALTEVNQAVFVKDLKYSKDKVHIKIDGEQILVKVEPPKVVEEELPVKAPEGEEVSQEAAEGAEDSGEKTESQEEKKDSKTEEEKKENK